MMKEETILNFPELELLPTIEDVAWIDVNDRLPDKPEMCLVYAENGIQISYFTPKRVFATDILYKSGVTHWMKLPIPPKK